MKTRRIVLIFSLILCLGMLVACNADVAEQNAGDKLAYATFKNDSKDFSVAYDGYKSFDDLYWYYKANKLDAYGRTGDTGSLYAKVPGDSEGKGLDGKTEALSEGKWQFTLMAFETALSETATGSKRYNAEGATQSAIYSGSTPASGSDVIVIRRNQTNYIPVTVTPVAGTGHIKFADAYYVWETGGSASNPDVKITITMPVKTGLTVTDYVITKVLSYSTTAGNYPISGYIWLKNDAATGTIDDSTSVEGYTNDIPAGVYAVSIVITPVDDEDNIIFADQNLSLKVFGGLTATISGSLKELLSYENYFAVPEVDVKVFNPDLTSEDGNKITSDYVAKDDKTSDNKTTVTFPKDALTSTNQHSLEIEVFSAAVSESKFVVETAGSQAVAGLDLKLKKVTRTSEGDVTEETVTEFANSKYATIVTYINPGLEDVVVKYNGEDKEQPRADGSKTRGAEGCNIAATLNGDSGLGYNPATGFLSFETNHFSEFYVQAKVYAQNVTTGKYYHSLKAAVDDAKDNQTIKLLDNIELTNTLETSKSFELDLNGRNISANNCRALLIKEGIVSIFGNGTISANGTVLNANSSVIRLGSLTSVSNVAKLTIGADVIVSSEKCYGITVFGYNVNDSSVGQELIVDGKVTVTGQNPAISGNGSSGLSKTKITINEGAVVSSTGVDTYNRGSAIYHPQAGTLLINGGTVSGPSAIEAKGGDVTIIGGEIKATASSLVHKNNSDGNSTAGYSIVAVKNGDYKGNGNYVISSGTFTGPVDVVEDSAAEFTPTISITGGTFDSDPTAYVAPGYYADETVTNTTWEVKPYSETDSDVSITNGTTTVYMPLNKFRDSVNSGTSFKGYTVTLIKDQVDLGSVSSWIPIGTKTHPFEGTFDGNNKTIRNLTITESVNDTATGFFGYVKGKVNESYTNLASVWDGTTLNEANIAESNYTAVIKRINFENVSIVNSETADDKPMRHTGGVVGYAENAYLLDLNVKSGAVSGRNGIGGIVGSFNASVAKGCSNSANITASEYNAGGIIGRCNADISGNTPRSAIISCSNSGSVKVTGTIDGQTAGGNVAGIVALAQATYGECGILVGCSNSGAISANNSTLSAYIGGVAGTVHGFELIKGCSNTGNLYSAGNAKCVAGIAALADYSIIGCTNSVDINVTADYLAGIFNEHTNHRTATYSECTNSGSLTNAKEGGLTENIYNKAYIN